MHLTSSFNVLLPCATALLCLVGVSAPLSVHGQEWNRFRGPNGSGESESKTVPGSWTDADLNWKVTLPGVGHSSPAIWQEKIFLLSANPDDATRYMLCLSTKDGSQLWRKDFPSKPHHLHVRSSYASCTPFVDADTVYVAWSDPDHTWLKAFAHDGKEKWSVDFGEWVSQHGFGSSPIVVGDLVILSCSQEPSKQPNTPDPKDSFVVAVDRKTGEVKWKTPRKTDTTSYSVPCVRQLPDEGGDEIVCCSTAEGIFALNPKNGEQNWALKVFDKRTVSSPFIAGGLVFGTTGSGGGGSYVVALSPKGAQPEVVYEVRKEAPYVPTPVARGELLFLWSDKGIVTCVQVADGKQVWQKRVNGAFSGSPIRVDDKVYCISEEGEVVVLAAEKEFKEIGRMSLGEPSRSTPAVSGGRMYLRTYSQLISVGGKTL
ncbi:MAG: PQQ-binding-like beta-propeller repeat protein [Pirellulales bacterium]